MGERKGGEVDQGKAAPAEERLALNRQDMYHQKDQMHLGCSGQIIRKKVSLYSMLII